MAQVLAYVQAGATAQPRLAPMGDVSSIYLYKKKANAEGLVVHGLAARQGAQMPYQEDLKQHRSRRKAACF